MYLITNLKLELFISFRRIGDVVQLVADVVLIRIITGRRSFNRIFLADGDIAILME